MKNSVYDFFDDIVCINLDICKDRREKVDYHFKNLNIPIRFLTVHKHSKGGMYGCFDSHIQIIKNAYDKDLDHILVFEDDIIPTDSYSEENMKLAINFMKENKDWDIFYLGCSFIKDTINGLEIVNSSHYINENIIKFNPFCTHALCYNKKSIKKIMETYEDYIEYIHYDMYVATYLNFNNYCFVPIMFDQDWYLETNNICADYMEYIVRSLLILIAYFNINYNYFYMYKLINRPEYYIFFKYVYLFFIAFFIFLFKKILIYNIIN